ncbi:MAG: START domain-containing protein [Pseudomonadales bacterium]
MPALNANFFAQTFAVIVLLAGIMALDLSHAAANEDWRPRDEKNGVHTWTKKIEGSKYHAVRGETILDSTVARLVAVINDAEACIEWADLCAKSFVQEQVTPREAYIYTLNDMPWPVKDREVLAHVKWTREGDRVEMQSKAIPGRIDASKGIVRIAQARAIWQFTPTADGRVHAVFEIHMDPNGAIPGWLLNRLVLNSPFNTFASLEKQASKEKYAGSTLPF